jgi:GT2 family glycosyltransferase
MIDGQSSDLKVGVILLNWNGGEFTIPCVESLLASDYQPWRILVFDNASTDGSPDQIARLFPEVFLIRSKQNLGFTGGNNAGIRELLRAGADLVWILNNDTIVDKRCLGTLVEQMQKEPDIAVATGKILYETPSNRIWYAGADWRYWFMTVPHRGALEIDDGQYDYPTDVDFISGCCMLARRWALERNGLFNERYFACVEDAEWCLRARRAGLRLRYVPQAILWHKVTASIRKNTTGKSAGTSSPLYYYLWTRNQIFMIRQHADRPRQWITALGYLLINRLYLSMGMIVLGRWNKLRALGRGIYDGLREDLAL